MKRKKLNSKNTSKRGKGGTETMKKGAILEFIFKSGGGKGGGHKANEIKEKYHHQKFDQGVSSLPGLTQLQAVCWKDREGGCS